jgi:hemolysin III
LAETVTLADTNTNQKVGDEICAESTVSVDAVDIHGEPPLQLDQEWANALTHGIGTVGAAVIGSLLVMAAIPKGTGLAIACGAYVAAAFGTFLFSTLSHVFLRQPLLNTMRAWDQAMIYTMISGTYTPIVYRFASDATQAPLLAGIWIAAGAGFLHKIALRHRINSSGTISYLLLGWLPAIPLAGHVPSTLVWSMIAGGVLYTVGVVFLINDSKAKYMHAGWHLSVMTAATVHYLGILYYVVDTS